jgi:hypothetical protein
VVVARTSPIRYAVERSEREGCGVGAGYHDSEPWAYRPNWNPSVVLTRRTRTFSDMLNTFCAAGLRVTECAEPQLTSEQAARYPHKQAWMDRYVGIVVFRLAAIQQRGAIGATNRTPVPLSARSRVAMSEQRIGPVEMVALPPTFR